MSSNLIGRIGEGLVVGITASVAFMIFSSMNDARIELGKARETLNLQLEVNQGLLDQTEALEEQVGGLESRLSSMEIKTPSMFDLETLNEDVSVDNGPSEVPRVTPLSHTESSIEWSQPVTVGSPPPRTTVQQRIDQQKQITQ